MNNITKLLVSILTFGYTVIGSYNNSAFAMAVESNNNESENEIVLSPLSQAVLQKNLQHVNLLIKFNVDLNAQDALGNTALMYAVLSGKTKIVTTLIQARATVDDHNLHDETALMWAAKHTKGPCIVEQLLMAKANPNGQDIGGCTPLMFIAWSGRTLVANLLLEAKAEPTLQDSKGHTALMYAIISKNSNTDLVQLLINAAISKYQAHVRFIIEEAVELPVEICKLIAGFDNPLEIVNFQEKSASTLAIEQGKNQDLALLSTALEESAQ